MGIRDSLGGECSTGLSYRAIDRDCCSGMHEADTRGGLGHRREWKSLPVGCISDAVEGDIARGVPALFWKGDCFYKLLIYNDLIILILCIVDCAGWPLRGFVDILRSLFIFMDKR